MRLIRELCEEVSYIEEGAEGAKSHYIHGPFLQANIKNRNGRFYPMEVLMNEVSRYVVDKIDKNGAYGELGHPDGPVINLSNASHLITELKVDGNNFMGKAKLLGTPAGNIVSVIMAAGGRVGVSSRAMGSLVAREDGVMEVQKDLHLSTAADIVADPSAPDAFVQGIMENVEWTFDETQGSWHMERLDNFKKELHGTKILKLTERQKAKILEDFFWQMSKKHV